jgi:thioesterase domain-containing protein
MSFGGIVAYEVAQQLRASGERVVFLGLLDAALPDPPLKQVLRLASLPRRELSSFVWTRVRSRVRELLRDKASAAPGKYGADERLGPLEDVREESYRRSALEYLPRVRRFAGDVTLIVAGQRLGQDLRRSPTCGWTAHVPSLDVHTVDSDHLELLSPPMVDQVADILLRALRRSDERARPVNDPNRDPNRSAPPFSPSRESVT